MWGLGSPRRRLLKTKMLDEKVCLVLCLFIPLLVWCCWMIGPRAVSAWCRLGVLFLCNYFGAFRVLGRRYDGLAFLGSLSGYKIIVRFWLSLESSVYNTTLSLLQRGIVWCIGPLLVETIQDITLAHFTILTCHLTSVTRLLELLEQCYEAWQL